MSLAYAALAVLALLLLIAFVVLVRHKNPWLLTLYASVTLVCFGYLLLSLSRTLEFALFANNLSYLGAISLPLCMLLSILDICGYKYRRRLPIVLGALGLFMFAVVCTSGFLPLYYRSVELVHVYGASRLVKVYGPLHNLYPIYLAGCFIAILSVIIYAALRKREASWKHATLLAAVVMGNLAVWLVEQLVDTDFEFLSVSYLFSEVLLLGMYWIMQDYVRYDLIPAPAETPAPVPPMEERVGLILATLPVGVTLHPRERQVLEAILDNKRRKDIAAELFLSENTVKTYTRNLYNKLGVASREELHALLKTE